MKEAHERQGYLIRADTKCQPCCNQPTRLTLGLLVRVLFSLARNQPCPMACPVHSSTTQNVAVKTPIGPNTLPYFSTSATSYLNWNQPPLHQDSEEPTTPARRSVWLYQFLRRRFLPSTTTATNNPPVTSNLPLSSAEFRSPVKNTGLQQATVILCPGPESFRLSFIDSVAFHLLAVFITWSITISVLL
ncbi:unnamed protein product [Protopolystoma xenopodis]|uniref:Uncharacterized protein n=1 Tax=Protopolystoma xenopodis TaxID=117903 RepID=A0A3S4ZMF6_9PLAT|nr:unnamed protein product [Protopolystoma xenopodis]